MMVRQGLNKMKQNRGNKNHLLIPFLRRALNLGLYGGLQWADMNKEIFYVDWAHKSSENWSSSEIEVCRAWAAYKGKLDGKNEKQIKATFRCAMNSKKELKLAYKTKKHRYWQFVDPSENNVDKNDKKQSKKGGKRKEKSVPVDCSFQHLEQHTTSSLSHSSDSRVAECSRLRLPSIETFYSFPLLTPPLQTSDIFFTDFFRSSTPPSEENRLTPPPDMSTLNNQYTSSQDRPQAVSSNVWNPNFLSLPQNCISFKQFSKQLDGLIKPLIENLPPDANCSINIKEIDQFVPAMDSYVDGIEPVSPYSNTEAFDNSEDCRNLDDDFLFGLDVDPVACDKVIEELNRLSDVSQ